MFTINNEGRMSNKIFFASCTLFIFFICALLFRNKQEYEHEEKMKQLEVELESFKIQKQEPEKLARKTFW